ncbi:alpha-amylase family glycosyl hydrolase [soil metagenome]
MDSETAPGGSWWREGVFYEIYPRSFQDSDGNGIGDLAGITARLDHLGGAPSSLGVDAIWITPFYPSPGRDYGYDVSDYCGVDPLFGTLAEFDALVAAAHARGIRVLVDLVPNHTSDQHPWFVDARSSRQSTKRDWYVWGDPRPNGRPPNNWKSAFRRVGGAWTFDPATAQYYLHHFMREQPDLNWWNPAVREAVHEVMRFWLERGVDGFRIDVAHGIVHDALLRDNRFVWLRRGGRYAHRWDWDRPEVHEVHRGFRRLLDSYGDRVAVGEIDLALPAIARYYGTGGDELHLGLNLHFNRIPWSARGFRRAVEEFDRVLPRDGWPNYGLSNHDRPRHASRFDDGKGAGTARARVAAMMLLTLRGTPFLYYGEELGMMDVPVPPELATDVAGRDPCRTPMQWDGTTNAGFTTGRPWLPVAADAARVNVVAQRDDPSSMLSLYRRLIGARRASPALRRGRYIAMRAPADCFAYRRETSDERVLVALNFSGRPRRLALGAGRADLLCSTDVARHGTRVEGELALGPLEGITVRLRA